jgi:ribosome-associated protein
MIAHVEIPCHMWGNTGESPATQRRNRCDRFAQNFTDRCNSASAKIEMTPKNVILPCTKTPKEDRSLSYTDTTAYAARPEPKASIPFDGGDILDLVLTSLDDNKAEDILTIDLRGKSAMADHMVICTGRSSRQVSAIASKLLDRLKESFRLSARTEGKDIGDWVLIDTGDVVVHIFRPEVREFYRLEKMWQESGQSPAG